MYNFLHMHSKFATMRKKKLQKVPKKCIGKTLERRENPKLEHLKSNFNKFGAIKNFAFFNALYGFFTKKLVP